MKGKKRVLLAVIAIIVMAIILHKNLSQIDPGAPLTDLKKDQLVLQISEFPKSFNYYVNNSSDASSVFDLVYASLMELDSNTLEYQPMVAESIEVSKDKKVFKVKINPNAKWADGKQITSADLKFTFDTIMNPENLTSVMRIYMSRLSDPKIIDDLTVEFTAKTVHFKNFEALAGFAVLPKHLFENKNFNKDFNMNLPVGSGPYTLDEVKEGRYYVLRRVENYWADELDYRQNTYNFKTLKYKVMSNDVAFEAFKKGDFDIFDSFTAKRWVEESDSEQFKRNWIIKHKVYNYAPRGIQGIAMNRKRPVFEKRQVREAMNKLLNREQILAKIMYNEYKPLNSYFPGLYENGEKSNANINYDPQAAIKLLREVGYSHLDDEGYLIDAAGKRLEFSLLYANKESERFLTLFAQDCQEVGVKLNLEYVSWATLIKKLDDYNFDAVCIAWSGTLTPDPEQLWHSKHVGEPGGSNLAGFANQEVDSLIDGLAADFDVRHRAEIIKKIDRLIYRDYPYILFWSSDCTRIFYKNIFGMPDTVFSKYSSDIIRNWWFDEEKAAAYKEAVKTKEPLPGKPLEIYYDRVNN